MKLTSNDILEWVKKEANFFRIHLLFFLVVPLVAAGIFYAANGQFPVGESFVSSLCELGEGANVDDIVVVGAESLGLREQAGLGCVFHTHCQLC